MLETTRNRSDKKFNQETPKYRNIRGCNKFCVPMFVMRNTLNCPGKLTGTAGTRLGRGTRSNAVYSPRQGSDPHPPINRPLSHTRREIQPNHVHGVESHFHQVESHFRFVEISYRSSGKTFSDNNIYGKRFKKIFGKMGASLIQGRAPFSPEACLLPSGDISRFPVGMDISRPSDNFPLGTHFPRVD